MNYLYKIRHALEKLWSKCFENTMMKSNHEQITQYKHKQSDDTKKKQCSFMSKNKARLFSSLVCCACGRHKPKPFLLLLGFFFTFRKVAVILTAFIHQ